MDGIYNIYKEKGFTSFDVVAKMRGILHMKKIGHTGTLDPDAEGVLPVCVGRATGLVSIMEDHDKTYQAVMLLGRVTDTQDTSGQTLKESEVHVTEEELMAVVERFTGPIMQVPPMYSALKVNGKKLYEYARAGITIEREARPITIHSLTVDKIDFPRVTMTVSCSKGTYIRTLCNDIGEALGCGGCMESLIRTRVGGFLLENSIRLSELQNLAGEEKTGSALIPLEQVFCGLTPVMTYGHGDVLAHNGNRLREDNLKKEIADPYQSPEKKTDSDRADSIALGSDGKLNGRRMYRLYDSDSHFLGIYEYDEQKKDYKPFKMFI